MPNSQHCFNCTKMKPCKCKGLPDLLKFRPFSKVFKYLCRSTQRRRSSRRFRSVHAVFWPLISMRSDEREREADNPSLTLTEAETDTETVLRPLSIEPTPLTSSYTKNELAPPPATSSSTKVEPVPPLNLSNVNVEPAHPPITASYTKAEPSHPPLTSSNTKVELSPPFASSYIKMATQLKDIGDNKTKEDFEVQKACRSFENYILEMLLEERKIRDLLDVEELIYCMDNLKSPAFIELFCTFYCEICVDLFSNEGDQSMLKAGGDF